MTQGETAADKIAIKDERGIGAGASTPDAPGVAPLRPRVHRHSSISCAYHDPAAPKLPGTGDTFPRATPGPEGGTFVRICTAEDGTEVSNRVVEIPPRPAPGPTPTTFEGTVVAVGKGALAGDRVLSVLVAQASVAEVAVAAGDGRISVASVG